MNKHSFNRLTFDRNAVFGHAARRAQMNRFRALAKPVPASWFERLVAAFWR